METTTIEPGKPNTTFIHAMTDKDVSTLQLAMQVGIGPSKISLIRRGWKTPSPELAQKLEAALGVTGIFAPQK